MNDHAQHINGGYFNLAHLQKTQNFTNTLEMDMTFNEIIIFQVKPYFSFFSYHIKTDRKSVV